MIAPISVPLFRFLWRRHRAAVLAVAAVPVLIGLAAGFVYDETAGQRDLLRKLLEAFPKFRRATDTETLDFLSPAGFFNTAFRHPLTFLSFALAAGIPAIITPAGDRGRGVLDLLLAAPLSRGALVRTVAAVVFLAALPLGLAPFCGAAAGALSVGRLGELPLARFALASANAAAFGACLGAVALRLSVGARDGAVATVRFAAFFIAAMLLDAFSMLWEGGAFLRWFTPAGYYRASEIVAGKSSPALSFGVLLGVAFLSAWSAVRAAERRIRA